LQSEPCSGWNWLRLQRCHPEHRDADHSHSEVLRSRCVQRIPTSRLGWLRLQHRDAECSVEAHAHSADLHAQPSSDFHSRADGLAHTGSNFHSAAHVGPCRRYSIAVQICSELRSVSLPLCRSEIDQSEAGVCRSAMPRTGAPSTATPTMPSLNTPSPTTIGPTTLSPMTRYPTFWPTYRPSLPPTRDVHRAIWTVLLTDFA
jgi:hypothetical protein